MERKTSDLLQRRTVVSVLDAAIPLEKQPRLCLPRKGMQGYRKGFSIHQRTQATRMRHCKQFPRTWAGLETSKAGGQTRGEEFSRVWGGMNKLVAGCRGMTGVVPPRDGIADSDVPCAAPQLSASMPAQRPLALLGLRPSFAPNCLHIGIPSWQLQLHACMCRAQRVKEG